MFINKNGKFKEFIDIWEKILGQLWEFYYYFLIDQFAQISYGYAITTHRSQGSTYKNVFVDLNDIIKNNIYKKEGFQCLYTAVTRASENLDILI
jgi:ATP-dependent exoDNAse (exonuclease V) alpha subunit